MSLAFQCPLCHQPLSKRSENDGLVCENHARFELDPNGFLRFLAEDDRFFSSHWQAHQNNDLPLAKRAAARRFLAPLLKWSPSGTWLDVGTGDGVHLSVLRELAPEARLIGMDLSASALTTCHARVPSAVLLQADAHEIPLAKASVDAAFSFGVLAYLREPWAGLAELVRVTRPGGLVGLWIYPRRSSILDRIFRMIRAIVPRLPSSLQARVADLIVPLLGFLPTAGGLHLGNASWKECREVVLVNIAPAHLSFPTREEVADKLTALDCRIVYEDREREITIWAVKGGM